MERDQAGMQEHMIDEKAFPPRTLAGLISSAKNEEWIRRSMRHMRTDQHRKQQRDSLSALSSNSERCWCAGF